MKQSEIVSELVEIIIKKIAFDNPTSNVKLDKVGLLTLVTNWLLDNDIRFKKEKV